MLEYYLEECEKTPEGEKFSLRPTACQGLIREDSMLYQRSRLLHFCENYARVARDLECRLKIADFLAEYAEEEKDRLILEQYRSQVVGVLGDSNVQLLLQKGEFRQAIDHAIQVVDDLRKLPEIFTQIGNSYVLVQHSAEYRKAYIDLLTERIDQIHELAEKMHPEITEMREKLEQALREDRVDTAFELSGKIKALGGRTLVDQATLIEGDTEELDLGNMFEK